MGRRCLGDTSLSTRHGARCLFMRYEEESKSSRSRFIYLARRDRG